MPEGYRRGPWPRRLVVHGAGVERQVDDLRAVVVGARDRVGDAVVGGEAVGVGRPVDPDLGLRGDPMMPDTNVPCRAP
jgi:hypothetical protein